MRSRSRTSRASRSARCAATAASAATRPSTRGREYDISLLPKAKIEVVVADDRVDAAIDAIMDAARTGEIGDGRVFVLPVEQSRIIRTGERDVV